MTAPNIVDVGTITGKTTYAALSTTNATTVLNNAASSGKVFKVNSLVVANVDGATAADITITVNSADDGAGTAYALAKTISVPADASLIVIDKSTALYLEEDRSIVATAGSANDLEIVISYEEIS
jgi:VCBS repeat-containing protein